MSNLFTKPRWKTYAAQSGFVYQYVFQGAREDEYQFHAVSGTQSERTHKVVLETGLLDAWAAANRPLLEIERFGIAKRALLAALDADPPPEVIRPDAAQIEAICRELDL